MAAFAGMTRRQLIAPCANGPGRSKSRQITAKGDRNSIELRLPFALCCRFGGRAATSAEGLMAPPHPVRRSTGSKPVDSTLVRVALAASGRCACSGRLAQSEAKRCLAGGLRVSRPSGTKRLI
jgi:hypothetical protein